MSIIHEDLKDLCIEGKLTNSQLADKFDVSVEEIYAWRSRHGMTIAKCQAIREGKATIGKRTKEEIMTEIKKVLKVKMDAEKRFKRAEDRLAELRKEAMEAGA